MNKQKQYYSDWRMENMCAYCGGYATTEDHVPSKCFLDHPHPDNPPVVPCCEKCNREFSIDEEYVSCFIDCVKERTVIPEEIRREKTRKSLIHTPKLARLIKSQIFDFGGVIQYEPDRSRFEKVMQKLAFGHLAYMNDTLTFDSDFEVTMSFLQEMHPSRRAVFERPYTGLLLPEVGSRALTRWAVAITYEDGDSKQFSSFSNWDVVQKGRYRYCVSPDSNKIKLVIAECLAAEINVNHSH